MPQQNDSFITTVKRIHLGWGEFPERHSPSRQAIIGEAYIKIPMEFARRFSIYNSNMPEANTLYDVRCINGNQIQGQLLAQGCSKAGDVYAKQFSVHGNLKQISQWYASVQAQPGGQVKITFTSPTSLTLHYLGLPQ